MNESLPRPTLLVHSAYFPSQDSDRERRAAETLGRALYKLLTRDPERPLDWGAGVPVRVATQFDRIALDEAEHVVVVAVLGQASHADENLRKRALAALHDWCERGVCVIPLLLHEGWRHSTELLPTGPAEHSPAATQPAAHMLQTSAKSSPAWISTMSIVDMLSMTRAMT